jgi:hypothetical protein
MAREMGLPKVILEMDCASAVIKVNEKEVDRSIHGPIVEEIKLMLQDFVEVQVKHVRRSCNEAAHKLAKVGCENNTCNRWMVSPPDFIVKTLASECAGN